jgi:ATP-binding cassette, subfamily B, multidrug efflux pump
VTSQRPGPAASDGANSDGAASAGASSNGAGGSGAVERATPKRGLGPDRATIGRGPAAFLSGRSTEKSLDFRGSSKRLLREMMPERLLAAGALLLAVVNVALTVTGPRLLGEATNLIFTGVVSQKIPPGTTKAEVVAGLQHEGKGNQAGLIQSLPLHPGQGVDFDALGRLLVIVLALYAAASVAALFQGRVTTTIVQRLVFRMRADVQAKLARLPLRYFDAQPRGEILSRVTNDIDNLAQSLQQTLSQVVTSVLTIVGVLFVMFLISPLLALIALVTVPVSVFTVSKIGKRAQPQFVRQWSTTGKLNGHIEEMFTGHELVTAYGRTRESMGVFDGYNEKLFTASFRAQFISGTIQPVMVFLGNINYVLIAVTGALQVASGSLSLGAVQAFIQYTRQFSQPMAQVASMANLLQSGIASAERVFALLDADEQAPDPAEPARPAGVQGRVEFRHVSFRYDPDIPLIEDLSLTVEPGQTVAIVGPTGAGKTTLVNLLMRFYEVTGGQITLDGVPVPAGRLRHGAGRGQRRGERGGAAAHHDRPGVPGPAGHSHPGRGDQLRGHPHRGAHPARDELAAPRPDQLRDRAPAVHDPGRRPDPGHGVRADRRAGHARQPADRGRRLRPAVRRPVRARAGGRGLAGAG